MDAFNIQQLIRDNDWNKGEIKRLKGELDSISSDNFIATLAAVTSERDRLRASIEWVRDNQHVCGSADWTIKTLLRRAGM